MDTSGVDTEPYTTEIADPGQCYGIGFASQARVYNLHPAKSAPFDEATPQGAPPDFFLTIKS
jgi:hypothetical protein